MPIPITAKTMRSRRSELEETRDRLYLEFRGLERREAYRLAFERMLRTDPLGRVAMLGNDQRDLLLPLLRERIAALPPDADLLDAGGGNGQTLMLAVDAARAPFTVHVDEPDPTYAAAYIERLRAEPLLREGQRWSCDFESLLADPSILGAEFDAVLAIHVLYFLRDLPAALRGMVGLLKPGGSAFVVFADERQGLTAHACQAWYRAAGLPDEAERHRRLAIERHRLLGPADEDGARLASVLDATTPARIESWNLRSRVYGTTLADLVALCQLTALGHTDGDAPFELERLDSALELLARRPEAVDLRIETEGPRAGMFSAAQPQIAARIERVEQPRSARKGSAVLVP